MKQYFQALPVNKLLLSLTLGFCSATSWAGPVSYYGEAAYLGRTGTATNVTSTPHGNPTTYSENVSNPFAISRESVTFTSTPAPSILATTSAYNSFGIIESFAMGWLSYDIGVSGPASTYVPVTFRGQYAMAGIDISGFSGSENVVNTTHISLFIHSNSEEPSEYVQLEYHCSRGCESTSLSGGYSVSRFEDTFNGMDSVTGNMFGAVPLLTDQFGLATATVTMQISASTLANSQSHIQIFNAMAYIDPEFHIDPDWLALNPGATLSLPEGVGNSITAVPLPGTLPLMLGGLGLLGALVRRRNQHIV